MTEVSKSSRSHCFPMMTGLAGLAMLLSSAAGLAQERTPASTTKEGPMVIAHRGGAMNRPENTMPAFQHAVDLGVEVVEFDMLMTADDRIVVYHDPVINREFCAAKEGSAAVPAAVRRLSFSETQEFDCGSGVRPAYARPGHIAAPGARIPALGEVLRTFRNSDAIFFAETKVPQAAPGVADIDPVKFATLLDAAVREHGLEDRLILQSFDFRTIDALHKINPRIRTCLLGVPKLTRDYLAAIRQHHASCIVLSHDEVSGPEVRKLQESGVLVYSGVVDDEAGWKKYVDLGVDAIFTNNPEHLMDFLKNAGLRN